MGAVPNVGYFKVWGVRISSSGIWASPKGKLDMITGCSRWMIVDYVGVIVIMGWNIQTVPLRAKAPSSEDHMGLGIGPLRHEEI